MESIIKWQTGEPKEDGVFIVTTLKGEIAISSYFKNYRIDEDYFKTCVAAWCKLSDIKPYKKEEV